MSHYAEDVEVTSPLVETVLGPGRVTIRGKPAVREYWSAGLAKYPDLYFRLFRAYAGPRSVVLHYQSVQGAGRRRVPGVRRGRPDPPRPGPLRPGAGSGGRVTPERPALVVCDLAGTTVHDRGEVPAAFGDALREADVSFDPAEVTAWRGASKREVLARLLARADGGVEVDGARVHQIYGRFQRPARDASGRGWAAFAAGRSRRLRAAAGARDSRGGHDRVRPPGGREHPGRGGLGTAAGRLDLQRGRNSGAPGSVHDLPGHGALRHRGRAPARRRGGHSARPGCRVERGSALADRRAHRGARPAPCWRPGRTRTCSTRSPTSRSSGSRGESTRRRLDAERGRSPEGLQHDAVALRQLFSVASCSALASVSRAKRRRIARKPTGRLLAHAQRPAEVQVAFGMHVAAPHGDRQRGRHGAKGHAGTGDQRLQQQIARARQQPGAAGGGVQARLDQGAAGVDVTAHRRVVEAPRRP